MDWNVPIAAAVLAVTLVLSGFVMIIQSDDTTVDPFEDEADASPMEERDAKEGEDAVNLSWWLGVGAVVLGALVGVWAWFRSRDAS